MAFYHIAYGFSPHEAWHFTAETVAKQACPYLFRSPPLGLGDEKEPLLPVFNTSANACGTVTCGKVTLYAAKKSLKREQRIEKTPTFASF